MNAFKEYLISTGQTVAEFATRAKISAQAVYKYASGERRPREAHFYKLVEASNGSLSWGTFYPAALKEFSPLPVTPKHAAPPKKS